VRAPTPLLALLAVAVLCGCGNVRAALPPLGPPDKPLGYETFRSPGGEVSFRHPSNWGLLRGRGPELARIYSGNALAAIYVYPRSDLPTGAAGVERSRRRLIASLERRARALRVVRSRVSEIDGSPAVEIGAAARIGERTVFERSVHVYEPGAEYVIDAYAARAVFGVADRWAFEPLLRSLTLAPNPGG
jgi:hypothetical protein